MTKKALAALSLGAALIVFLAVMYVFYPSGAPQVSPDKPGAPSEVPYRTAPEFAGKPAQPDAPSPAAPTTLAPPTPAPPPPELKPPAAQETKPPVVEPEEQFGLLVGRYRTYKEAAKIMEKVQKEGKPAFIRRDGRRPKPYSVWAGPFPSREESKLAAKTIRAKLKVAPKPEKLRQPVPK